MRTAHELQDFYVSLLINTLSEEEYREELIRLKYILGAYPKPQRTEAEQMFINYVADNIYKGNTTSDLFYNKYAIYPINANEKEIISIFGSINEAQNAFNDLQKKACAIINANYEKHQDVLNSILT